MHKYLIDTNIFIESSRRYYGFDICPGFWDWLRNASQTNDRIKSIKKVREELKPKDEKLSKFIAKMSNGFFIDENEVIKQESYAKVSRVLIEKGYENNAVNEFSNGADYFLIALAYQDGYKIVTHETRADNTKKKIKIPNVCEKLQIECIDIATLLREEKVRFYYDLKNSIPLFAPQ